MVRLLFLERYVKPYSKYYYFMRLGFIRIAARFMYHCLIVDLSLHGKEFSFQIIECLAFKSKVLDVKVSKYTGFVMIWPANGDLFLWEQNSLRSIYKRQFDVGKIGNYLICIFIEDY